MLYPQTKFDIIIILVYCCHISFSRLKQIIYFPKTTIADCGEETFLSWQLLLQQIYAIDEFSPVLVKVGLYMKIYTTQAHIAKGKK